MQDMSIEAKQALASARVARAYYPIVVPATVFVKSRKATGKGGRGRTEQERGEQRPRPWHRQSTWSF
eukprot:6011015-Lingulodinium_polyedra.AAC.1